MKRFLVDEVHWTSDCFMITLRVSAQERRWFSFWKRTIREERWYRITKQKNDQNWTIQTPGGEICHTKDSVIADIADRIRGYYIQQRRWFVDTRPILIPPGKILVDGSIVFNQTSWL